MQKKSKQRSYSLPPEKIEGALLNDLKQLWYDFLRVYPRSFNWITTHWKLSLILLFILSSAFYLDSAVRFIFMGFRNELLDSIADFGRWYGGGFPTQSLFLLFYIGGLLFQKYYVRNVGLLIFETYIYSGLVTLIFKSFFGRWRPFALQGEFSFYGLTLGPNEQLSFSSGHASVSFALSCVLASTTKNVYLKIFYYLLAVITSFSRMYHDQHWFSDVVMGTYIGILISTMLIQMHKEKHKW